MTILSSGHLRKADLSHGDERLLLTGTFDLHHSMVTMTIRDPAGIAFLLDSVLVHATTPTTVSMLLKPRNHRPETASPPEFPPSNLLFGVDQRHAVAAAALLAFDRDRHSHQWLPSGSAWRPQAPPLAMDPANPDDTPFPSDAYITFAQLREVVSSWSWGVELPPAGVEWRPATEREVRWSWF